MKEIVFNEAPSISLPIPGEILARFRETRAAVDARSTIVWGEHCSECAFPDCYSSCEFYTPRPDMHCRRFMHGIERVTVPGDGFHGLTRIAFRLWGKLEGTGPVHLLPTANATRKEARAATLDSVLAALALPRWIGSRLANRLNGRRNAMAHRTSTLDADAFLIEGWLDHPTPIMLTLTLLPWNKAATGLFQTQCIFTQGYNRHLVPMAAIRQSITLDQPFALQIEVVGEVPEHPIVFGIVDFIRAPALKLSTEVRTSKSIPSKTAKCVVWDLDDTVWSGTLVEDGIEGVHLNPTVAETIRMLDARGILNSVASKNDEALAHAALAHFGLAEYMLFPQIGWGPKSDAIRRIAAALDIGIDTFVFVDDQPFERGEVAVAHPALTTMTPEEMNGFTMHPLFDVPVTEESKQRRLLYRNEEKRQSASANSTDYIGFLRSCDITLTIGAVTHASAERVYELTQRTNQLNVTGARFTREHIQQFVDGTSATQGLILHCRDRFGDYGIIGFCVLQTIEPRIEAFFMSCRVQRKRVEHAFFAWLANELFHSNKHSLAISYSKTAKNNAAVAMFNELGFTLQETSPGAGSFTRDITLPWVDADIVTVKRDI